MSIVMFGSVIYYSTVYPASSITDLSAVDASLKAMELQVQAIKDRLREEAEAIPKAKVCNFYFILVNFLFIFSRKCREEKKIH